MGKKKKDTLGRALIKDRFSGRRINKGHDSLLHTSELNDGYDWGRLNLQSVTEQSSFEEFLSTAQLAGTEFQAEKLNVTFVNPKVNTGVLSPEERKQFEKLKKENQNELKIPRRPKWDQDTTAEELAAAERESFLDWRRRLARLEEMEQVMLTPFEKNLDLWRQLWRVVDRSDVVVQIVDARNPLMFWCEDLVKYVKEVDETKRSLVLINKGDFLDEEQRRTWRKYFASLGIETLFFSALQEGERSGEEVEDERKDTGVNEVEESIHKEVEEPCESVEKDEITIIEEDKGETSRKGEETCPLLTKEELIEVFEDLGEGQELTIGLVGYPNVGKSSTINALMGAKRVSVSATPGKTKHFQTMKLSPKITLCDCPGLVMPSFVSSRAEMLLFGTLPVDQMKDFREPAALLQDLVPLHILEDVYSIMIPGADRLLASYAYSRGLMTQNGQPDESRAARYLVKDFVNGRIVYCKAPPGVDQEKYHKWRLRPRKKKLAQVTPAALRAIQEVKPSAESLDKVFFSKLNMGAHTKGVNKTNATSTVTGAKPWKDHSEKRNRKEKLRRVYRHLDE